MHFDRLLFSVSCSFFLFWFLFCFPRRPSGGASSALARHPHPFVSPFWSVRCRLSSSGRHQKARRCVINNQRQTMSRQMSQRTAAKTTTTPTTHVQMGSTAISYTIIARGVCCFIALYVFYGASALNLFSFLFFFIEIR